MSDKNKNESCACTAYFSYMVKVGRPKLSLIENTCKECGKQFMSNIIKEICFECEHKIEETI